jgi:DNA-binding transcriptional LysR family regulator
LLRQVNRDPQHNDQGRYGNVHITCPEAIADWILAPAQPQLLAAPPGIAVRITASDALLDLNRLDCDIALRIGNRPTAMRWW